MITFMFLSQQDFDDGVFPKDAYNNALVRVVRQVRNFEFPGCSSAWQVIQVMRDLSILSSIAEKTFRTYNIYGGFLWFINVFDLYITDPSAIEFYISYLLVNVQGYKARIVKAAIQFFADLESRPVVVADSYNLNYEMGTDKDRSFHQINLHHQANCDGSGPWGGFFTRDSRLFVTNSSIFDAKYVRKCFTKNDALYSCLQLTLLRK